MIAEIVVDEGALRRNVARLRGLVAPARYAAVVKGNAYGHGLVPVAWAIESALDGYCVYRADEALALRAAGIAKPILILGPVESHELETVHASGAAVALWSEGGFLRDLERVAERRGSPFPVHVKIDTGVTRFGFEAPEATAALERLLDRPALGVRGAFTHLAAVEEFEASFTWAQRDRFVAALAPLRARLAERGVALHAAASAAAILVPELRFDLVRAGIATYGIWPSVRTRYAAPAGFALEPALTWASKLVVVRDVQAGRAVGYGCAYETTRPSRIGVLPIGYAEGIPRAYAGRGLALVCGERVPFVGRICMNVAFVDVTDVPHAVSGSRVVLIGRDGEATLDANEAAEAAGTIGYELVTRLPAEIPRRYVAAVSSPEANAASASARSIVPS